jgi:hypothetical protein
MKLKKQHESVFFKRKDSKKDRAFNELMSYLVKGDETQVNKVLSEISKEEYSTFLFKERDFSDLSQRHFNCSPFAYIWWARDFHMLLLLDRYMTEPMTVKALETARKIEEKELKFDCKKNQSHFDFAPLVKALKKCINLFSRIEELFKERRSTEDEMIELEMAWRSIADEQQMVPAHVAQEYCRDDVNFHLWHHKDRFKERNLPRILSYWNCNEKKYKDWFSSQDVSNQYIKNTTKYRGGMEHACGLYFEHIPMYKHDLEVDLNAMLELDKVRTEQMNNYLATGVFMEKDVCLKKESYVMMS